MKSTVLAVYDDISKAQAAMEQLVKTGFGRNDMELITGEQGRDLASAQAGTRADSDPEIDHTKSGTKVNLVFDSIFGGEYGGSSSDQDYHGDVYNEALRRGSCVLAVQSGNDEQHAEIINVMDRFDPVDIDDRAANWRSQGWSRYDSSAPRLSDDEIQRERSGYVTSSSDNRQGDMLRSAPIQSDSRNRVADSANLQNNTLTGSATMAGMSQQVGSHAGTDTGSTGFSEVRRSAVRSYPHRTDSQAFSSGQSGMESGLGGNELRAGESLEDSDFRNHWQSNYGHGGERYEDYAPAYRYGSTLASDEQYRGAQWNDVESDARTNWEANHSDSPWEKAKDAVRYGWEKMTR